MIARLPCYYNSFFSRTAQLTGWPRASEASGRPFRVQLHVGFFNIFYCIVLQVVLVLLYYIRFLKKEKTMQTAISKLTKKYQATVPEAVRSKLNLKAGDVIAFEIENEIIKIRKAQSIDIEFSSALVPTLSEWNSQNDEEAYNDL
jgi:antitoxin PrlF